MNKEHIKKLILDRIAGTITPENDTYLSEVIQTDPQASMLWQELQDKYDSPQMREAIERSMERLQPEKVIAEARHRGRIARIKKVTAVAAAIVLIILAGYGVYFWMGNGKISSPPLAATDHVKLQLEDGSSYDLTLQKGNVQHAGITYQNGNKTLSFSGAQSQNPVWATVTVPVGQDYQILLPDSSVVWLNAGTSLRFPSSFPGDREVFVNGEAFFKVAKDISKPFNVHMPATLVRVLGTEFNVNTYDSGRVAVALVEGSVRLTSSSDSTVLKPGFQGIASAGERKLAISQFDEENVLAWRQGLHLLEKASAAEVCRQIYRNYGITAQLDKPLPAQHTFTGSMDRKKPIEEFLNNLKFLDFIDDYYFSSDKKILHLR